MPIFTPPKLEDLPPPPPGKTGWPWTEQSQPLPEKMSDGSEYPRVSIVTPSYSQGQFIEETIRSVLLQGYPNLEYIIIDGGSTDNSVKIIKKYERWLKYWQSQKDGGQSDALNQGFAISTGEIMGWVNSDDFLLKEAFSHLLEVYKPGLNWWTGSACQILKETRVNTDPQNQISFSEKDILYARAIVFQVSTFWTRKLWTTAGSFVSSLHLAMDYELWLRFSKCSASIPIYWNLGAFRTHIAAKTSSDQGMQAYLEECDLVRTIEFEKRRQTFLARSILICFWTRFFLVKRHNWRSWIGKRPIPYV